MNFEELDEILNPKKEYVDPYVARQIAEEARRAAEEARRAAEIQERANRGRVAFQAIQNWTLAPNSRTFVKYGYNEEHQVFAFQRKNTNEIVYYNITRWNLNRYIARLNRGVSLPAVIKSVMSYRTPWGTFPA